MAPQNVSIKDTAHRRRGSFALGGRVPDGWEEYTEVYSLGFSHTRKQSEHGRNLMLWSYSAAFTTIKGLCSRNFLFESLDNLYPWQARSAVNSALDKLEVFRN